MKDVTIKGDVITRVISRSAKGCQVVIQTPIKGVKNHRGNQAIKSVTKHLLNKPRKGEQDGTIKEA
tara:strand:+ start:3177 stop:3374 length:198 start_codon:yes stop_codon:yes gene_type:complete